ncbi:major facilitator superfamily MFS_1 [Alkaliphilus metalliredigens QYMF]|uniref:Major facilitator superfamily MFS_1 n=1 Tax=Alkaliphilus metalliredigens (strain QYMF) TaxID=293826 RepID=A6TLF7_ALKMQ|nr:MFS transporter [Alkaliphilus metalliredigens]ABR47025.1 major facilitator superfamily MFS_1 [Alkaliphilus metalliredigens QYMF]
MTQAEKVKKLERYRWVVWGILVVAYVIVFFHRLALGVVRQDLVDTFNITGTTFANLGSMYFYPYMFMQIPAGILADSLGARKTVTYGTLLAGLGSIIFGLAPSILWAFVGRLLVGLGVSVVFIAILKIQSQWFKESEFGTMSGMTSFVGNLGGVMAQTPLALVVAAFTWRTTFVGIGLISLVVAFLCYWVVRNTPEEMGLPSIAEIEGKERPSQAPQRPPIGESLVRVLTNPRTWPSFFMFTGFFGAFISLTGAWGQSYLIEVYDLPSTVAPNYLMAATLGLAIGSFAIGKISDVMKRRKLPMIVFGAIYTITWGILVFVNGGKPPIAMLYPLFFVMGFTCSAFVLSWACGKEVNHPSIAGISTSVVNIGGFLGSAILPPILGRVFDAYGGVLEPTALFQRAFMYCFAFVAVSFLFAFLVKETHCRNIYIEKKA